MLGEGQIAEEQDLESEQSHASVKARRAEVVSSALEYFSWPSHFNLPYSCRRPMGWSRGSTQSVVLEAGVAQNLSREIVDACDSRV